MTDLTPSVGDIGLSKTGYTEEAGRCLIMRIKAAGKNATVVLLNARANSARIMDALNIRRFITGDQGRAATRVARAAPASLIKASAGRMKAAKVTNNGRKKAAPSKKPRRRRAE
ncbi:hypothetical protein [Massilia sp. YMA4]|uniref:hypothetical protein n=1 Tax=Massilia sp. YMA4 TaxID=1593482 RepID=UPI0026A0CF1F|nr:hypothetical protein [Massilia sp. YMA4]